MRLKMIVHPENPRKSKILGLPDTGYPSCKSSLCQSGFGIRYAYTEPARFSRAARNSALDWQWSRANLALPAAPVQAVNCTPRGSVTLAIYCQNRPGRFLFRAALALDIGLQSGVTWNRIWSKGVRVRFHGCLAICAVFIIGSCGRFEQRRRVRQHLKVKARQTQGVLPRKLLGRELASAWI